ncbi:hypothetical protein HK104_008906 [Borealophlyctis nickersoniae]|nr:hypothetical protein HK104_008906 [Borealophlyctis nickersoniae]
MFSIRRIIPVLARARREPLVAFPRLVRLASTKPEPSFSHPSPIPLGDKEAQKEFEELIKTAESGTDPHPDVEKEPIKPEFEGDKNPVTGEVNGPKGKEPTRYGDWERKGRVYDF